MLPQLAMEFGVQSSIHQPHIVQALRLAEDDTHAYMLLKLCVGGSVWQATHNFPMHAAPEDIARRWLRGAAEGIAYLHDFGLIHRDVKLENMLLDRDGHVRLGDFGWCAFEVDCPSGICGTPQLASPEVTSSDLQTSKMDIWALGACLVQLLKGIPLNGPQDAWLHREASLQAHELADCILIVDPAARADIRTALGCTFLRDAETRASTPRSNVRSPMWPGETSALTSGLRPGGELAERVRQASLRLCAAAGHADQAEEVVQTKSFCWNKRSSPSHSPKRRRAQALGDLPPAEAAAAAQPAEVLPSSWKAEPRCQCPGEPIAVEADPAPEELHERGSRREPHARRATEPASSKTMESQGRSCHTPSGRAVRPQLHVWARAYAEEARCAAQEARQGAEAAVALVQECRAAELCSAQLQLQEWSELLGAQGRLSRALAERLAAPSA